MIHHFGEFSSDLVNGLAEGVEEILISSGASKKLMKRVFSIVIEGLQNIRLHGERDEHGYQGAYLLINKGKENYQIIMGNLLNQEDRELIDKYLKKINKMDMVELKEFYSELLSNSFFTRKGGAGLGFLTMRLKSENELNYEIKQLASDKCFFTVEVTINKNC